MTTCSERRPSPAGRLRPLPTLRRRSQFDFVYTHGLRSSGSLVLVHALRRQDDGLTRLGLTTSRRCGKACVRNRLRRRLREIVRLQAPAIPPGWDIILTGRQAAADASYEQLRSHVVRSLIRLQVLPAHDSSA